MPASLTPEQLDHVARVARLPLTAEERTRLLAEAQRILAQFAEVEGALARAPAAPEGAGLPPRDDDPDAPDPARAERIKEQFPRRLGALCKVPEGL